MSRTPFFVLTGFLGSGKTTLLSRLLDEGTGDRTAVLINEVGEVALDHHLLERVDDDVTLLPSGCICCTIRGELSGAIARVLDLSPARVVLETTGLADPAPLLHALATDPAIAPRVALARVVATVDAARGPATLEQPEAALQLDLADLAVRTKLDLAAPADAAETSRHLRERHPGLAVVDVRTGAELRAIFDDAPLPALRDRGEADRWLVHRASPLDHRASTRVIELPSPVDLIALELWLRMVARVDGEALLRVKGLVEHGGRLHVLQSAQHAVSPLRELGSRPPSWQGSRLVVIARGLSARTLEALERSAIDAARGLRRG